MWLSEGCQDGRLVLAHLGGPVCSQGKDSFPKQEGRAGVSEEVSCGAGGWTGVGPLAKECGQPVLPQGFQALPPCFRIWPPELYLNKCVSFLTCLVYGNFLPHQ